MSERAFPMGVFVAVALTIALIAFGLAQLAPGAGIPFVAAASGLWVAYVSARHRWMKNDG